MQNKPNFQDGRINLTSCKKKAYENIANWTLSENKPNSNPIKPNCRKGKIDAKFVFTKDYKKNAAKDYEKTNPISSKAKMNANAFSQKDYENETTSRLPKYKPNQTQFQRQKNAPAPLRSRCVAQIFEKLLICTCFYSIIVLIYALYIEIRLSVDYGESAKCKLGTLFLQWYFGGANTRYLLSKSANS
jgi:hypothetical protein